MLRDYALTGSSGRGSRPGKGDLTAGGCGIRDVHVPSVVRIKDEE